MSDTMVAPIPVLISETSDFATFKIIDTENEEAAARRYLSYRLKAENIGKTFVVWTMTEADQIPKRRELKVGFLGSIGFAFWE